MLNPFNVVVDEGFALRVAGDFSAIREFYKAMYCQMSHILWDLFIELEIFSHSLFFLSNYSITRVI